MVKSWGTLQSPGRVAAHVSNVRRQFMKITLSLQSCGTRMQWQAQKNHLEGYSQDYSFNPVSTVSGARNADCSITTTCRCTGTLTSGIGSSFWIALLSFWKSISFNIKSEVLWTTLIIHWFERAPQVCLRYLEMLSMLMWYQDLTGSNCACSSLGHWLSMTPKGSERKQGRHGLTINAWSR